MSVLESMTFVCLVLVFLRAGDYCKVIQHKCVLQKIKNLNSAKFTLTSQVNSGRTWDGVQFF